MGSRVPSDKHSTDRIPRSPKRARVESNTLQTTGVDRLIREAVLSIAPKEVLEWDKPKIMLNRNVTCRRHRDANECYSFLLWLGDFEGGALHFDDGTCLREKGVWHKVNGRIPHWNDTHTGTKYSIILYQQNHTSKQELIAERGKVNCCGCCDGFEKEKNV